MWEESIFEQEHTVHPKATVKFFLPTTSLLKYAVAAELLCPFGSMNVAILVAPSEPRTVLTSLQLKTTAISRRIGTDGGEANVRIIFDPDFFKSSQTRLTDLATIRVACVPESGGSTFFDLNIRIRQVGSIFFRGAEESASGECE